MRWLTWRFLDGWEDVGLLILRVGLGLSMMVHGWPKLSGGPETWTKLGGSMASLGITFAPTFWGLCGALAEFVGGAMLVLGLGTRPAAAALAFTMLVAVRMHQAGGDGFHGYSHALEVGIAMVAILLVGPGRHALDPRLKGG